MGAYPEHRREKFLGQLELIGAHAVGGHEQPARASLFNGMHPIAACCADELAHQGVGVAMQLRVQDGAALEGSPKPIRAHARSRSRAPGK